jgi:hypothetical protein
VTAEAGRSRLARDDCDQYMSWVIDGDAGLVVVRQMYRFGASHGDACRTMTARTAGDRTLTAPAVEARRRINRQVFWALPGWMLAAADARLAPMH